MTEEPQNDNHTLDLFENPYVQEEQVLRLTVSELNHHVKTILEQSFPSLYVEGEISNLVRHRSGHWYFTLKDDRASVRCVIFKWHTSRQPATVEDGMKVLAYANLTVYEKGGQYQLQILRLQPLGIGDLQQAFDALKKKLYEEGLFDVELKRALPAFPVTIGVVTSPTGAAIRDIIKVIKRRFPPVRIILRPTLVQGSEAAEDISRAIEEFNEFGSVDVLIVGRGGGSIEDLWAFNEEIVARAIAASKIPVISAVGHEIDFTISDFVADIRVPTPSAAGEQAVPDADEILARIHGSLERIESCVTSILDQMTETVKRLSESFVFRRFDQFLGDWIQRVDELRTRFTLSMAAKLKQKKSITDGIIGRLGALNPEGILQRGYSITKRSRDGKILLSADEALVGEAISIQLARGKLGAEVTNQE